MAKGDKVAQTQGSTPIWQQLANMNLNYPSSVVQQPPYGGLTSPMGPYNMNPYSMLNLPTNLSGNSGLPNNGLQPNTMSFISSLFGGSNPLTTMMNPNASSSLLASPQQSALTPSQNLVQQYFGQSSNPLGLPQAPVNTLNPGTISSPIMRSYSSPTPQTSGSMPTYGGIL